MKIKKVFNKFNVLKFNKFNKIEQNLLKYWEFYAALLNQLWSRRFKK